MAGGRPTKYDPKFNKQAKKLCILGATDAEMADFFGVNVDSIHTWKKKYPKFSDAIKAGKILADIKVGESLYKLALGYEFNEVTFEKLDNKVNLEITKDGDLTKDDTYKKKVVTKQMAPNVTAQIFWLKNRQKAAWRDKQEHELTGSGGKDLIPAAITNVIIENPHARNTGEAGQTDEAAV